MGTVSYAVLSQTLHIFQVSKPNIRQFPSLEMPLAMIPVGRTTGIYKEKPRPEPGQVMH